MEPYLVVAALIGTIFVVVCQEFESVDKVVTDSVCRRVCSKHFCFSVVRAVLYGQDSVRGPSKCTGRQTPHTTSCTASFRALKRPDVVSKRISVTIRGHTCDNVTPPYPSTGAMCRPRKPSLFSRISRLPPCSESVSVRELFSNRLTFLALYALRISKPSKRKAVLCRKSSSSLL